MSYASIASSLNTILTTVKNAPGSILAQVFDYDLQVADDNGYPFASIVNGDAEESVLDSAYNEAEYHFFIRVCDLAKDKSATEVNMRILVDAILAELRKKTNLYLSNTVDNTLPFRVRWSWEGSGTVPLRVCTIEIVGMKQHSTL